MMYWEPFYLFMYSYRQENATSKHTPSNTNGPISVATNLHKSNLININVILQYAKAHIMCIVLPSPSVVSTSLIHDIHSIVYFTQNYQKNAMHCCCWEESSVTTALLLLLALICGCKIMCVILLKYRPLQYGITCEYN